MDITSFKKYFKYILERNSRTLTIISLTSGSGISTTQAIPARTPNPGERKIFVIDGRLVTLADN